MSTDGLSLAERIKLQKEEEAATAGHVTTELLSSANLGGVDAKNQNVSSEAGTEAIAKDDSTEHQGDSHQPLAGQSTEDDFQKGLVGEGAPIDTPLFDLQNEEPVLEEGQEFGTLQDYYKAHEAELVGLQTLADYTPPAGSYKALNLNQFFLKDGTKVSKNRFGYYVLDEIAEDDREEAKENLEYFLNKDYGYVELVE